MTRSNMSYSDRKAVMKQKIALLGSTGSIGEQALDVVRTRSDRFEVAVLTAGRNWKRLVEQAIEFEPDAVVIAEENHYRELREALSSRPVKVYAGADAIEQVVRGGNVDVVVNALVGYAGMKPSLAAVQGGKKLALANKESLVIAGRQIISAAEENGASILPVDSEHSAIFQSMVGEVSPARRLILTASGGPFLRTPREKLCEVTVEQALKHPNWRMGAKITVDSATMVNKGFEVIEAHWLFGFPAGRIDVLVHPQSVVHSMVEYEDGAVKAQLGTPDMRLPIQYALTFPDRPDYGGSRLDFAKTGTLTFEEVDGEKFPALGIAYECLRRGGSAPCVMNAANEVAVSAFLQGKIRYIDIVRLIERALEQANHLVDPQVDDYVYLDNEVRRMTTEWI